MCEGDRRDDLPTRSDYFPFPGQSWLLEQLIKRAEGAHGRGKQEVKMGFFDLKLKHLASPPSTWHWLFGLLHKSLIMLNYFSIFSMPNLLSVFNPKGCWIFF